MAQSRQVKLGAFYESYAAEIAKPSPVGIPTKRANLALDGWAAGEELMRQPMRRGRDQERIAEILLEKEFPSSNFVVESVAFPKEPLSLDHSPSSFEMFKSEAATDWHLYCMREGQSGVDGIFTIHDEDVEITVAEPRILALSKRGTVKLEDGTFVTSLPTFCATRFDLLTHLLKAKKMDQVYDRLMCMCLYFAAISDANGVPRQSRFEIRNRDWTQFLKINKQYDTDSVFSTDGRWRAWDVLRMYGEEFDGWYEAAAARWAPESDQDRTLLIGTCQRMHDLLIRLCRPITTVQRDAAWDKYGGGLMHLRRKRPAEEDHHDPHGFIPNANARRLAHPLPSRPERPRQINPEYNARARRDSHRMEDSQAPRIWRH